MEPIRILHVVGRMHRAGLETFIMNVYRNIDRSKVQFDFLTHYIKEGDYDKEIIKLGGKIYRLPLMENKNIYQYLRDLDSFFKNHKEYDIVHGHWTTFGLFYMYYAKKYGIKHRISHAHASKTKLRISGVIKAMLAKSMKFVSNIYFGCSESAVKWLYGKQSKIVKSGRARVINNAIDLEKFSFNKSIREQYRSKMKLQNKFVIGHIGRLNHVKNQEFVIKVYNEFIKKCPDSALILIGTGEDQEKLEKMVKQYSLDNNVLFLGSRGDIPELLCVMDVFLFPSKHEALGIVTIEAQASGLPVIVSTEIPPEAHVTDNIKAISLSKSEEEWAKELLKFNNFTRTNTIDEIRASGFDIRELGKELEKFYLSLK